MGQQVDESEACNEDLQTVEKDCRRTDLEQTWKGCPCIGGLQLGGWDGTVRWDIHVKKKSRARPHSKPEPGTVSLKDPVYRLKTTSPP